MYNDYLKAIELLKFVSDEYGLDIDLDNMFKSDGYWAFWPCKLNKNKWPKGFHNLRRPTKIRIDFRGPEAAFIINGWEIYVDQDHKLNKWPLVPLY